MKKLLFFPLLAILVGCGSSGSSSNNEAPDDQCPAAVKTGHEIIYTRTFDGRDVTAIVEYGHQQTVTRSANCPAPEPPWAPPPFEMPPPEACYTHIGFILPIKWEVQEPFVIDPSNLVGLDESKVTAAYLDSLAAWEDEVATGIMGQHSVRPVSAQTRAQILTGNFNGINEVIFDAVPFANAIAVAWVYHDKGVIFEVDVVFDDVDFDWTFNGLLDTKKMDFTNIATHELGHKIGLGHADALLCPDHTMFFASKFGEVDKATLEFGDIDGARFLYGTPSWATNDISNVWSSR